MLVNNGGHSFKKNKWYFIYIISYLLLLQIIKKNLKFSLL